MTANIVINAVADAPVITQGAGPLTKTVIEDGLASWTTAELDATDVDTLGALIECKYRRVMVRQMYREVEPRRPLLLISRMPTLMARIALKYRFKLSRIEYYCGSGE